VPRRTLGSLVIFGLATSWGIISILVREVPLPALALACWRMLLAAASLGLVIVVTGRRALLRRPSRELVLLGLLLGAHWACFFGAIQETSVASANLVTYTTPLVTALIAPVLIAERIGPRTAGALAVSLAGIAIVTLFGPTGGESAVRPLGVGLAALAALSYGLLIVLVKKWAHEVEPVRVALIQTSVGALLLSPALVVADYGDMTGKAWAELALLGIVLTGLSGFLYMTAIRWVDATEAGILSYVEPVSAAILAVLLLGESLTAAVVIGGVLIVGSGVAVILADEGREVERVPPPG
jgi:DME family drug/metabolite transporter